MLPSFAQLLDLFGRFGLRGTPSRALVFLVFDLYGAGSNCLLHAFIML